MLVCPVLSESIEAAVGAAEVDFALALVPGKAYELVSTTACWVKQGASIRITVSTKANATAGDYFALVIDGAGEQWYQLDKTGADAHLATPAGGLVVVDISSATTAAQVAALVKAAMDTNTPASVGWTDNADGTIDLLTNGVHVAVTEHCAHAAFTVANHTALAATAGSGSHFVPASTRVYVDGKFGPQVSIIRDAADGKASLARARQVSV